MTASGRCYEMTHAFTEQQSVHLPFGALLAGRSKSSCSSSSTSSRCLRGGQRQLLAAHAARDGHAQTLWRAAAAGREKLPAVRLQLLVVEPI